MTLHIILLVMAREIVCFCLQWTECHLFLFCECESTTYLTVTHLTLQEVSGPLTPMSIPPFFALVKQQTKQPTESQNRNNTATRKICFPASPEEELVYTSLTVGLEGLLSFYDYCCTECHPFFSKNGCI